MKALVKKEAREGLWLEDVPTPKPGINDVLIRVLRTAICGTDMHIYNWDEWAQKTIPVPMIVGHEFVGEIVEVGSNVNDFRPGQIVSGEGRGLRALPQLYGRASTPVQEDQRYRREPSWRVRRVHGAADVQRVGAHARHRS